MGAPHRPAVGRPVYFLLAFCAVLVFLNGTVGTRIWQILPSLVAAGLLVALQTGFGFAIQHRLRGEAGSLLRALAFGQMWTTGFFFAAAAIGWLSIWTLAVYLAVTLAVILCIAPELPVVSLRNTGREATGVYVVSAVALMFATLPSTFFDTLVYHLGLPNLYVQWGGLTTLPRFLYANTSIYYEINLIPTVLSGDAVPRLYHFLLALLFLFALARFAEARFLKKKGWLPVLLILTSPMGFFLTTTVKNDLTAALLILAGIEASLDKRTVPAGLFFGFAVGVKYFSLLPAAIFLLALSVSRRRLPLRAMAVIALTAMIAILPLLIKNGLQTGNPVYPFFNSLLNASPDIPVHMDTIQRDVGRIIQQPSDIITLPVTLSFDEWGFGGLPGAQYLVFLPFLILLKKRNSLLLVFALMVLLFGSLFTASSRFMFIAFIILSIYVALIAENLDRPLVRTLLTIIIAVNVITTIAYHERINRSHLVHTGKTTGSTYAARLFPAYRAFTFINRHTAGNARILLVGETRNYYLKRPYLVSSALDRPLPIDLVASSTDQNGFESALRKRSISHVLVNINELRRIQQQYHLFSSAESRRIQMMIDQLPILFRDGPVSVYEVPSS